MVQSNRAADSFDSSVLFRNFSGSFEDEDDDEHEDDLVSSPKCVRAIDDHCCGGIVT